MSLYAKSETEKASRSSLSF